MRVNPTQILVLSPRGGPLLRMKNAIPTPTRKWGHTSLQAIVSSVDVIFRSSSIDAEALKQVIWDIQYVVTSSQPYLSIRLYGLKSVSGERRIFHLMSPSFQEFIWYSLLGVRIANTSPPRRSSLEVAGVSAFQSCPRKDMELTMGTSFSEQLQRCYGSCSLSAPEGSFICTNPADES